jgi:hypothetical protein
MLATLLIALVQNPAFVHSPTAAYTKLSVHGFDVLVSPAAMADKKATDKALGLLEQKLGEVCRVVPRSAVEKLRAVKVWVELNNPGNPGAVYHPTSTWLKDNGYNVDKAQCIEIGNVRNFVEWAVKVQPMMVLHEMAHAYHHINFGFDFSKAVAAYDEAVKAGHYEKVRFVSGGEKRHYALTNVMEYFAEASEAYFGLNDFYPFNRWQLLTHDRKAYEVLVEMWGLPAGQSMVIGTTATPDVLKSVGRHRASP